MVHTYHYRSEVNRHRSGGRVVRASASNAGGSGFDSQCRRAVLSPPFLTGRKVSRPGARCCGDTSYPEKAASPFLSLLSTNIVDTTKLLATQCTVDIRLYVHERCGCGYTARRVAVDVPLPKAAGNEATVPHVYTEVLAKVLVSHSGLHYINKSFRQPPEGRECTMFLRLSDEQRIFLTF